MKLALRPTPRLIATPTAPSPAEGSAQASRIEAKRTTAGPAFSATAHTAPGSARTRTVDE